MFVSETVKVEVLCLDMCVNCKKFGWSEYKGGGNAKFCGAGFFLGFVVKLIDTSHSHIVEYVFKLLVYESITM